jgi:hypothetical protein
VTTLGALPVVWFKLPLVYVAIVGVLAEWIALEVAVRQLSARDGISTMGCHFWAVLCVLLTAGAQFVQLKLLRGASIPMQFAVTSCAVLFVMLAFYFVSPEARKVVNQSGVYVRSKLGFANSPEPVR